MASSYRDGGREKKERNWFFNSEILLLEFFPDMDMPGIQTLDTLPSSAAVALKKGKEKRNDKLRDRAQNEVCVCVGG